MYLILYCFYNFFYLNYISLSFRKSTKLSLICKILQGMIYSVSSQNNDGNFFIAASAAAFLSRRNAVFLEEYFSSLFYPFLQIEIVLVLVVKD